MKWTIAAVYFYTHVEEVRQMFKMVCYQVVSFFTIPPRLLIHALTRILFLFAL